MSSGDRFSYPGKVSEGDVYEVFRNNGERVLSTSDFDGEIDWASRSTVRRRLESMRNSDSLESKKAGDQPNAGEVWYPPDEIGEIPEPTPNVIKLIYRNPWYSIMVSGFIFIAFGFLLFMPGFFGDGQYFGILDRRWLVDVSIALYVAGVLIASLGAGIIVGRDLTSFIGSFLNQS